MLTIIGISGKKQSGKDTLAKHIARLSAFPVTRIAFADALKEEVAKACGVSVEFVEKHKDDFRTMLQWWGTDFKRKFNGNDYWVNKLLFKMNEFDSSVPSVILITDVRFQTEAAVLKQIDAYVIRINRKFDPSQISMHSSETDLDLYQHFDLVCDNDADVQKLEMYAEMVLQRFKLPLKNKQKQNI